jgi:putative peptidoglycan lipid II flippase
VKARASQSPVGQPSVRGGATVVVLAVSLSRIAGLLRERFFAQYLGTSAAADAFGAALRIPLLLEGVLGERVFSSAFIPRYSRLLAEGSPAEASRLALAVASFHTAIVAGIVWAGVLLAPYLVSWIAPGFDAPTAALTIHLVRILFPAVGLLVLGAWCLAILNSHRMFFLPYIVPVLSAASISAALIWAGSSRDRTDVAVAAAWGALVGALLQLLVQLPFVIRPMGRAAARSATSRGHFRDVARNALPAAGRGLIGRAGTWLEVAIAGFVATGAIAGLGYAQLLYSLPVGLFTVAISAALLPELSAASADHDTLASRLVAALDSALRHTAYLLVACAAAFIGLGDVVVAAVYQGGQFGPDDVLFVWVILGALSIGLVGVSMGGLYATAFYAIGDTRTPLKASIVRLAARGVLGVVLAIPVVRLLGLDPKWGAAGLGAAIGTSGWIEFVLLRGWLDDRLGRVRSPHLGPFLLRLWAAAAAAAVVAWVVKLAIPAEHPIGRAAATLGTYGLVYVGITLAAGMREPFSFLAQMRSWTNR